MVPTNWEDRRSKARRKKMKWPKIRELGEALRSLFSSPYTSKFPKKASLPPPRFRGTIVFDETKCIGCGACVEVCPAKARALEDDVEKGIRHVVYLKDMCIYCGQCVAYCPCPGAIRHTLDYDLSFTDKEGYKDSIDKELVFCELCEAVITTKDHLNWIARRVGELAYANPTLILARQQELSTVELGPTGEGTEPYRSGHQRLLCPDCRRKVWLNEIWGY
ncbi:4Fe-4S dicluster domain-containing protein [candidate division WOR-3 bacterium]|uniref:4Fe-4S dicluster domain-containing protein n=1 Tax=candidate division WOR-3 bacterium TaxID=2052148 RepID=A0A9D5KAG0_UNCW3|nr:4Fe-4S dicluster domain-containing protein [candidate division WOR-3 bacterium]MBD3364236.1 4Fe-4S dicluster domain-containing protein [candidate division WOR-3 bacterium]